ncbi:MAG: hypothetical protein ACR2JC_08525 [Chloroflexota bacterium]|nr:MAG: hypothetical protein DLM70_15225 [Chloroflexota bacterium]
MSDTRPQPTHHRPDEDHASIPDVEDLFDVAMDETDFMSAQSFPCSDPPPSPSAIAPGQGPGERSPSD